MTRIIFSLAVILGAASVAYAGSTGAFFNDTETSTGNTFTTGAIDLKVDNESYYDGALSASTTWPLSDLQVNGNTIHKFFDFLDVKPSDYGEDTVSLHVNTNDAYLCGSVTLTSNNENGCTEPEAKVDNTCGDPGPGEGELAQHINFIWWADLNGDNVLEANEPILPAGNLGQLGIGNPYDFTLADSQTNIWNVASAGGPVAGNTTYHIGKAWCLGTISADPLPAGSYFADGPAGDNNHDGKAGTPEDGGITCDGSQLGNETQTDSLTADVTFTATQSRNNPDYVCPAACVLNENLIADSSFESPVVTDPKMWDIYPSPVDGWSVAWRDASTTTYQTQTRPADPQLELHRGILGPASDGQQYAELDSDWGGPNDSRSGEPASVSIYQDIATTPGADYTLSYDFAARPNTAASENKLGVYVGGALAQTQGPLAGGASTVWHSYTVNFTATTTSTQVRFTDLGTSDSLGTFLDNVKLVQTTCGPVAAQ